ncbi:unnamed protein product [Tetraodon nigroviridis]|uniref:(spotted green pufferfish) hypothetical protein n=1 Tax=Tetraodon nigroviridis TaxID=99883 RepID=Q4S781_TETNG|nr:unnamed protein product [Tetraodon nigroviridis]
MEEEKMNGTPSTVTFDSVPKPSDRTGDGHFSMKCILKASPFLSTDGDENEEETARPEPKFHKDKHGSDDLSKLKSQVVRSARVVFDERVSQRQYPACSQAADRDAMTEDLYLSQKREKMAAIAAAFSKRESAGKFESLSADVDPKAIKMASSSSMLSPSAAQRRNPEREMFTIRRDNSPFLVPGTSESKINVRTDFLRESVLGCSDILAEERQLSQCLVQSSKKDQEFRSIFQHIQNAQLQRSPSELFAQHIVAIVHHIKAQHFPPCVVTLNERFTMYQRRAAEKEMMKPRKSPEIHRRIDVSPRAFKKHSQLFEAMKSSEDDAYKDGGGKPKSDPMDLRLDIERRKKYCTPEKLQNREREMKNSGRETSRDNFSKCHKSSKKSKRRRSRSSSSSSSSSSSESQTDELPPDKGHPKDKSLNKGSPSESPGSVEITRPLGGFQVQIRGRGWNRGSFQGNCSHSNNLMLLPNKDEWDPEYTPKSRKYYLVGLICFLPNISQYALASLI